MVHLSGTGSKSLRAFYGDGDQKKNALGKSKMTRPITTDGHVSISGSGGHSFPFSPRSVQMEVGEDGGRPSWTPWKDSKRTSTWILPGHRVKCNEAVEVKVEPE
jgi:hypothetical protein